MFLMHSILESGHWTKGKHQEDNKEEAIAIWPGFVLPSSNARRTLSRPSRCQLLLYGFCWLVSYAILPYWSWS